MIQKRKSYFLTRRREWYISRLLTHSGLAGKQLERYLSPATIGLPNRYNLVLHFPIFILIYYGSNLVKKQLSYEALKIVQRVFNGRTKMKDGGQSQGPFLLIFNLRDQSDVLCKSHRPFLLIIIIIIIIIIIFHHLTKEKQGGTDHWRNMVMNPFCFVF